MAPLERTEAGAVFRGVLESSDDRAAAASIAASCSSHRLDDDDEDYLAGALSCFSCRYRRWVPNGFTCMKDALAGERVSAV
jgi:hypothetical protein